MEIKSKKILALPFLLLFILLLAAMPRVARLSLEYSKGQPWKYETLIAPFDFPILKSSEQILDEMGEASVQFTPYYKYATATVQKSLKTTENLDLGDYNPMKSDIVKAMNQVFSAGIVGDDGVVTDGNGNLPSLVYIQKDKRASAFPAEEVYRLSDARNTVLHNLEATYPEANVDSVLKASGIYDLLVPVLTYDKQTTELVGESGSNTVSPTSGYVRAGQLIVSNGEIVTAEIAQMLDSYKKEYEANMGYSGPDFLFWLGNGILAAAIVLLVFLAIYFCEREVFKEFNRLLYLLMVVLICLLAAILVPKVEPNLIYMVPFTLITIILQPFFKDRLIMSVYPVALLPLLIYAEHGVVIYTMFLVAGIVAIYTSKTMNKGWRQFLGALITYAILLLIYLAFRCIDVVGGGILRASVLLLAAALLPIAGYPLTSLSEKVFNLVSPNRLSELAEQSNPLLKELEKKAPGTFQHSIQLMNMADPVARALNANVQLVRTGALYHDIGKMDNPLCFVENEKLLLYDQTKAYHTSLTPEQSAADIIAHVDNGIELAQKHHLPSVIVDFIRTHHGTQRQAYFYDKYVKAGGDPANTAPFIYHGVKPFTKEQVILMVCDSVEAGARSLDNYNKESYAEFVDKIVDGKIQASQFDDAPITIQEIKTLKDTLVGYLQQIYHNRIKYPEAKESNKQ